MKKLLLIPLWFILTNFTDKTSDEVYFDQKYILAYEDETVTCYMPRNYKENQRAGIRASMIDYIYWEYSEKHDNRK